MFRIVNFPSALKGFFGSLTTCFHWEHFEYFRLLVLLVAFAWGRRNVSNLCRHLPDCGRPHRTRFNNFLLLDRWDAEAALRTKAYELLRRLDPHPGDVVELIIDDSKKEKRGRDMEAVGFLHDPVTGRKVRGHDYVKAVIRFKGYTIPFAIALYVKREHCRAVGVRFRKLTQIASEFINAFSPPDGIKVRVLFDSFYFCRLVAEACRAKGFRFVSTIKSNRSLFKGGRKLKAGRYAKSLFGRGKKRSMTIKKDGGSVRYTYADAGALMLNGVGEARVIFSRKGGEKHILGIATDDTTLKADEIIRAYDDRWAIEVFFKSAKQHLGLGQYQNGSYRAAVTHLHLVCFAHALLTHIAMDGESAKGKRNNARRRSTADLQNELRRIVWEDLADHLRRLPDGNSVIKELGRLLIVA